MENNLDNINNKISNIIPVMEEISADHKKAEELTEQIYGFLNYMEKASNEYFLEDRHGNLWEMEQISFHEEWISIKLGKKGTSNFSSLMIAKDGHINELYEYKIVKKKR